MHRWSNWTGSTVWYAAWNMPPQFKLCLCRRFHHKKEVKPTASWWTGKDMHMCTFSESTGIKLHVGLREPVCFKLLITITLTPKFVSFNTLFTMHMPVTHHIFISVWALTPNMNPSALSGLINRLVKLTMTTMQQSALSVGKHSLGVQEPFPVRKNP